MDSNSGLLGKSPVLNPTWPHPRLYWYWYHYTWLHPCCINYYGHVFKQGRYVWVVSCFHIKHLMLILIWWGQSGAKLLLSLTLCNSMCLPQFNGWKIQPLNYYNVFFSCTFMWGFHITPTCSNSTQQGPIQLTVLQCEWLSLLSVSCRGLLVCDTVLLFGYFPSIIKYFTL